MDNPRQEKFALLNDLEAVNVALRALTHLVTAAIEQGDDFSHVASGIHKLFAGQCDRVEMIETAIRAELVQSDELAGKRLNEVAPPLATSKPDFRQRTMEMIADLMARECTLSEIEHLTGLSPSRVCEIIEEMPDHLRSHAVLSLKKVRTSLNTKTLRDQFIVDKAREGVDASEIAQAVNLKRSTVERVIAQLIGVADAESSAGIKTGAA